MAQKKFSEMDMIMMELQKIGNDEFMLGFQYPGNTLEEVLTEAIKKLQDYLENNKENKDKVAPYGYRINLELFKKGEPKNIF